MVAPALQPVSGQLDHLSCKVEDGAVLERRVQCVLGYLKATPSQINLSAGS